MPVQNRMLAAAAAIAALGFVAACQVEPPVPPDVAAPGPNTPQQAPIAKPEARQIVVQAGQSLSRVAATYGVAQRAIIAANDLTPPYKIKIGQQLLIPGADGPPPAPAVAESAPSEAVPADRPALPGSTDQPPTAAAASPPPSVAPAVAPLEAAAPAGDKSPEPSPPPAVAPLEAAAPAGDKSPEPSPPPVVAAPVSSGSVELPAPAPTDAATAPTAVPTDAATAPTAVPAAAPPGVTCPSGTIGMWSDHDIIKKPVYICHNPQSQS